MINKLKIGFLATALSLAMIGALPLVASAAVGVTYSSDTPFTVNGRSYLILAGSTATTVQVTGTTIVVTMSTAGPLTLSSVLGDTLTNNGGLASTCNGYISSVVVPANTASVTFTPTSVVACTVTGGGGLSGGGGGGGGGGSYTPSGGTTSTVAQSSTPVTLQISPTITMTTTSPGCSGGNLYNTSTGALCVNNSTSMSSSLTFNLGVRVLRNGSRGNDVKELQRLLNQLLNLGLVLDGRLGPKTIAVIKTWQKNHGLVTDGLVGPKTKAAMKAEAGAN